MANPLRLKIYEVAKAKHISIRKMERDLGYPERTISKMDIHDPSIERVKEIANYLEVSIDLLTENEQPEKSIADMDDLRYLHDNPETRMLLKTMKEMNLTKDSIAKLTEIAKILNENGSL